MTMENHEVQLYPPWREAANKFLALNAQPGFVITHAWLYDAFNIVMPRETTTLKEATKAELAYLTQVERFKESLLQEHNIALKTVYGMGYEVLHPRDQTPWAQDEGDREIKKGLRKLAARLVHVDHARLNDREKRENADALARAAGMRAMFKQIDSRFALPDNSDD